MRREILAGVIVAAAPLGALAQDFNMRCEKGDDVRAVRIVAPGEVGRACDVRYARQDESDVSVPYHADNTPAFCDAKAAKLVKSLTDSGYACQKAETQSFVEVTAFRDPEAEADAVSGENAAPEETDDGALEEEMRAILTEPAAAGDRESALRGPSLLTPDGAPPAESLRSAPAVGRLVGAAPETAPAPRPAVSVAAAGLTVNAPAPSEAQPTPAAPAAPPSGRTTAEIIRATLKAQAAAWNEGDLDAFMETYWKSDELKFVSDVTVTRGWAATLKRYRERYADETGLGWLSFEKLDVAMAGDDVAIVTGRFNLAKNDKTSSGVFTLVMRRMEGVWRIVHDHTSADPKPAE